MNTISRFREWLQDRRDNRARKLMNEYADIHSLYRRGIVRAKGTGQSIANINAEIESRVRISIKVVVPHGTYFKSTGSHQNMATREEYFIILEPMSTKCIYISASCINASLPIPTQSDSFHGVARVPKKLAEFLKAANDEDAMTVQAGVWAITDGYTGSQVQRHLRIQSSKPILVNSRFPALGSAVSDENIKRAREILSRLNIRTNL